MDKKLLSEKDDKKLRKSIDWKGNCQTVRDSSESPTDSSFSAYFENLTKTNDGLDLNSYEPTCFKYIPILDDPILPGEVLDCVRHLCSNKAAGVDGIPPGISKHLNDERLLLVTYLLNLVFDGDYLDLWSTAKIFALYKKETNSIPEMLEQSVKYPP